MSSWQETILVAVISFAGLLAGAGMARLGRRAGYWACLLTAFVVLFLAAGRFVPYWQHPVLFVLAGGRIKFVLLSFFIAFGLAGARAYLPYRIERQAVLVLIAMAIYVFGVFPFMGAAVAADMLAGKAGHYDSDGVCIQSTSFTCGPAAASTALRRMGLDVSEGRLAELSRSCPYIGTSDYDLARGICLSADNRIQCRYGRFDSLPQGQMFLAVMRQNAWMNHCVAVIKATEYAVVFADPAEGLITLSREQFNTYWTGCGIELRPTTSPKGI